MARVCLVAREHHPHGGGIGTSVPALAAALAAEHDVVHITDGAQGPLPPSPPGVRRVAMAGWETWERDGFASEWHAWSAAALRGVEEAYGEGPGPDLVEAPDYCGEAHVLLQAARTGHHLLEETRVVVRMRGTAEVSMLHNDWWPTDDTALAIYAMERAVLRRADHAIHAGGATAAAYHQYYGADGLAPVSLVRLPRPEVPDLAPAPPRAPDAPLRLLYVGRLERRKGVLDLVEAMASVPDLPVTLTLIGSDTRTGPYGQSIAATCSSVSGGDQRIDRRPPASRPEVLAEMVAADVVVIPSRFEWWANVAQEALAVGTPILATPVGGLIEQVVPGVTGWLTRGVGAAALADAIEELSRDRAAVDRVRADGGPRRHLASLTDPSEILASYRSLLAAPPHRPVARPRAARVTAVITTFDDGPLIDRAARSFRSESGALGDAVVVDDGSAETSQLEGLRSESWVRVVHRPRGGPGAARNTGLVFAEAELVLFLDGDDELLPGFLERAIGALEADQELGYAVPWHDLGGSAGWCPLGTGADLVTSLNVHGGSCALLRREALTDVGGCEASNPLNWDRELLERLDGAGWRGVVVPVRGVRSIRQATGISARYLAANRGASLMEIEARRRSREVTWTTIG